MLTVNDLKYSVGNYKILNGVSFNVKDKEFVGIMGPNGSENPLYSRISTSLPSPTAAR